MTQTSTTNTGPRLPLALRSGRTLRWLRAWAVRYAAGHERHFREMGRSSATRWPAA